jgi:hypothetical protein
MPWTGLRHKSFLTLIDIFHGSNKSEVLTLLEVMVGSDMWAYLLSY